MGLKSGSRCRLRKDRYGRMVAQVVREAALPATILMTRHGTAGYYRVRRSHHLATTRHRWPQFVRGFHGERRCRFDFAFDPAAMYQCARSSREPVSTSPENALNATPSARAAPGEVAEWSNAPHSKCGIGASLSGVRIPPSPPVFKSYPPLSPREKPLKNCASGLRECASAEACIPRCSP